MMFTWIPIHKEATSRILQYRHDQNELLAVLREMEQRRLKVISILDQDADGKSIPLGEIDPFTFLASFNRGITEKNRKDNWRFLKARWGLEAAVPDDFTGIPILHNMSSWLFPYAGWRQKDHVAKLWQLAVSAAEGGIDKVDAELFNQCLELKKVGISSLTIGMFWINPQRFLPADHKTVAYGNAKGINITPKDYQTYRDWLYEMTERIGADYAQTSHDAHLFATHNDSQFELTPAQMEALWKRFHERVTGFTDFQHPGNEFVAEETEYKRSILENFQKELGPEKLSELLAQGHGMQAVKEISRVLGSNIVSFHSWNSFGKTDPVACEILKNCLQATEQPYEGPETTNDLFNAYAKHNVKPDWDALSTLFWALRPQDFFPIKISYYRDLGEELGHELPAGRPDAERLHSVIEFGRAFWKALEPQKPSDWVDVQSFIWCVCPGSYTESDAAAKIPPMVKGSLVGRAALIMQLAKEKKTANEVLAAVKAKYPWGVNLKWIVGELEKANARIHKQCEAQAPGDDTVPSEDKGKHEAGELHETLRENPPRQYWTLAAGTGGEHWKEFYETGIAAIGWDGTPDLRQFKSKEEIRQNLQELWPSNSSKMHDVHALWQFLHDIEQGDVIFAKQGLKKLLGYGIVEGDYQFDAQRSHYRHVRKVKWLKKGEWDMPEDSKMCVKTLTDVTPYPDFVQLLASKVGLEMMAERDRAVITAPPPTGVGYWWLNANPKIWNFEETPVGQKQTYTSHNEKGNKRQKYKYFQEVKPGDLVIGYVTSPQREVVAVCKIIRGLHLTENGEKIEFEKIEQLAKPIAYAELQASPDLANSEPIVSNQGSLFKLTEQEYEIIRSMIDETNVPLQSKIEVYDKDKAMKGLFLAETQFDEMLDALKEKKNVVLQGAPGVGKTYVAKRIAYALIGSNDPQRVEVIQFHQSYSYEDFIQGFRPTPKGHFDLKYGIFHQFCRRAQREEAQGKPYVFIIDEINRGNLSKIFGELMMLIEPDKRGKEHAIPLAYSLDADERFYIPENLHLIGMMNTADRSLAMVDYALRRRFRFITLRPEFASKAFADFLNQVGVKAELGKKIVNRMAALNEAIAADTKNLGPGYQIGHSYFCPRNGIMPDDDWYRRVVESEILPLIQEYWFDNEQRVKEHRSALLA